MVMLRTGKLSYAVYRKGPRSNSLQCIGFGG